MSVQPTSNSGHSTALVSKNNRLRFSLYFIAGTILASVLSIYPVSALLNLLSSVYPSNPVQPNLPAPIGFLDIPLGTHTSEFDQGWIHYFGLLHSILIQVIFGTFTGIFQWIVLRQYLSTGNWILATILGYQIAGLLASNPFSPAIYYAFVCRGFFQWLILRQIVCDSWIWLLTHPLAFLLASGLGFLLSQDLIRDSWIIYSSLLGILQAIVLCIFVQKRNQAI